MTETNTPVIIGAGQYTQPRDLQEPLDPARLMAISGRRAMSDTGVRDIGKRIDGLFVVNLFSWAYRNVCDALSEFAGIRPQHQVYGSLGGNTPQLMVNRAAAAIESGKCRSVLIAGGEAGFSARRMKSENNPPNWPEKASPDAVEADAREPFTPHEMMYDVFAPAHTYAFFENALRKAYGWTIETHRQKLGDLCQQLSSIAAEHPHAWSPQKWTASEIISPSPENRYVAFPYTLRMCANLYVDMSAAILMTSEKEARTMGVDPSRWVYPMGGAGLMNVWNVSRRPRLDASPAMGQSARMALRQAGCTIADMGVFDFYSCFPCVVEMACRELEIQLDDERDFSVTGGLPFFGGPGNNYALHAIATMVEKIREDRNLKGLVTAMGWYNTKLAVGIYGADPPAMPWQEQDASVEQNEIWSHALPPPVEQPDGLLTVETYIICHDRMGAPEHGTVIGKLQDGRRTMAFIDVPANKLAIFEKEELIGRVGRIRHDARTGKNLFQP